MRSGRAACAAAVDRLVRRLAPDWTREAAASLFLSPKTIEFHLRNVYRKLDTHSRKELAAALTEPGSADS